MYSLPILYTCIYAREEKSPRKVFHDASKQGLEGARDLDAIFKQRT